MTVRDLAQRLGAEILVEGELDRPVTAGYAGDLLSWVMGRAQCGDVWITIMSNINVAAVASLADVACVLLAEGVVPEEDVIRTAEQKGINLLCAQQPAYELAVRLHELGL